MVTKTWADEQADEIRRLDEMLAQRKTSAPAKKSSAPAKKSSAPTKKSSAPAKKSSGPFTCRAASMAAPEPGRIILAEGVPGFTCDEIPRVYLPAAPPGAALSSSAAEAVVKAVQDGPATRPQLTDREAAALVDHLEASIAALKSIDGQISPERHGYTGRNSGAKWRARDRTEVLERVKKMFSPAPPAATRIFAKSPEELARLPESDLNELVKLTETGVLPPSDFPTQKAEALKRRIFSSLDRLEAQREDQDRETASGEEMVERLEGVIHDRLRALEALGVPESQATDLFGRRWG